ncbi:predicted protein [Nematostella vectensis]|uniref:Apple domain-containing protein n=1 Tax=Nematostella vectensis TaxID=45351 RepID=A7RMX2_NEMVE|nr:predicted protein [Nematostella vectensis]|eukprot:XP_001639284.1 predicted protein [Nematostella vectensis]
MHFPPPLEDHALFNHTLQNITDISLDNCKVKCYVNQACHAVNYKKGTNLGSCELLSAKAGSFPIDLLRFPGIDFYGPTIIPQMGAEICGQANRKLYLLLILCITVFMVHAACQLITHLGCYQDSSDRAVGQLAVYPADLTGCLDYATGQGYTVFAMENTIECFTGANANKTYSKHGPSDNCINGVGGRWALDVYRINYVT